MRTLDEVIKNFEICRKARLNLISCDGCTYAIGDNDFCIDCNEIDVLEWLKGYQKHIELDKLRDKYGETSQITCPKCHSEFVILPDANNPLTWDELKQMEGKPVWLERTEKYCYPRWVIIERIYEWDSIDDSTMIVQPDDEELFLSEHGETWQAYRKERENETN